MTLPEYGRLAEYDERTLLAGIDALLASGRLARAGREYPNVWMPGKPIRPPKARRQDETNPASPRGRPASRRFGGDVARALDQYRRRRARSLGWKTYMVFQRNVLMAIDREEPDSLEALARIPGLGPMKLERFGEDILEIVRVHGGRPRS